jgi:hypothetical protein
MAASAITPTILPVTASMIVVSTVLVDCIKTRATRHWGRHHCRAQLCPNPDNVSNGPPLVEHIHVLGLKADKLVPLSACAGTTKPCSFFARLPLTTLAATLPKFYRSAIPRCSICTTLIKSVKKTITSVIATAIRRRFYDLFEGNRDVH